MIELENAAYGYSGEDVLTDMSLALRSGTFHFLTGPSGAGKSTFLKLCYMEFVPSRGLVQVFGEDVKALDRDQITKMRRRMGIVHQDCKFLDHLSVEENIRLPLLVSGRDGAFDQQNLTELLNWVGLGARKQACPPELSGGERQRAALARAVIMDPEIILADEPTGNVDWEMSQRLMALLIELNRMGKSVLIATHDMHLIRSAKTQVSARVLRIKDKTLQLAGANL